MNQLLASRWTYVAMRVVGFGLLAGYLWRSGDWRVSVPWALAFPAISFSVAWAFVALKLFDRFPRLNARLLYPPTNRSAGNGLSEDEWALRKARYLEGGLRGWAILTAPAEDGFICVPLLILGITPISALLGGIAFGLIHLARFTYLECIGKAVSYTLVCYFVLPFGLLTVVLGHLVTDVLGFAAIKVTKHRLSRNACL
jgi:hypothetical protein